jgi:HEAT repeat protein
VPSLLSIVVLLLSPLLPAQAGGGDEQVVAEFKKYFREYKDTATRVEAVLSLLDCESPSVVEALVPILKLEDPEVVRSAVRVLGSFETRPPVDAMLARLESDKTEVVRVGLLRALAEGRYPDVGASVTVLLADKAWDVRRRAVQALAALGDPACAEALAPLCDDVEPGVACAAFEGLAALRSPLVVPPAIRHLNDEVWQVRASAIAALRQVRRRESIEPLIQRMAVEEGRLVADIGEALGEITGRFFGQRLESWQGFWDTFKDKFEIPSDEELAQRKAKAKENAEKYKPSGPQTTYHGIETPSRKILFVIDVSGSMENLVVEEERFADGGYPSMLRIDIVKTELQRTLDGLEPYVEFNIIAFATDVKFWSKDLVRANVVKKSAARDWVGKLEALGGASKEDLARVGLVGTANLEAGKTNTYGALAAALGIDSEKKSDDYEVAVDTIFFLSDGRPSAGKYVDPDDILREIKTANELRKIVVHTIAIGEFQKDFMKRLAEENGGVFVDLGR